MAGTWQEQAQKKRESILAAIPQEWRIEAPPKESQVDVTGSFVHQFLNEREIEITETTANEIVKKTTIGLWKAEEVIRAFCHRAALAHQLTNCLHEIFFDAAIEDAKAQDEYFAKHKKPIGPLHGLPVSLKDQFHVKGVETTMGYVGWIGTFEGKKGTGKEKVFESEMVRELRNLGVILFCKTAVPHTLMSGETTNNIIGYTSNPKNRNLAAGGSSGGEGALIGLRGSPVGFGSDIGGSIRIPAAFNGLYGIRPSVGRLPYEGVANSMDGQNSILSVVGPLAPSVADLRLLTKAILSQNPWLHDPLVHEIPWRYSSEQEILALTGAIGDASQVGKLSIGILHTDGVVNPLPPIRRALSIVATKLQQLGHEVLPWTPTPTHSSLLATGLKSWAFDAGADVKSAFALSGETPVDQVSFLMHYKHHFSASEIAATNVEIRQLRKQYLEYWNDTVKQTSTGRPVDAVIAPVAPFPAARPGLYNYYGYSAFVNVLDYTAVAFPVTNVDKAVDKVEEGYKPISDSDKGTYESYDPDIYDGAHVSLQLIGRKLQEEKMLALAEYIGKLIGK
ncbi:amidase [Aaosphaeria arxii CBS 175.79]|uniref:amidase n=1 Tax=Aaosphaeria arxii CBS 175.79 TaxID=1450172 RepID=A0A6A5X984_9PLEO|nr:amidase [Aaosphaeria arxii CBS 175.79]KAF2009501.1 amidase [Aaosphaeria arxii CBS 175.79]